MVPGDFPGLVWVFGEDGCGRLDCGGFDSPWFSDQGGGYGVVGFEAGCGVNVTWSDYGY